MAPGRICRYADGDDTGTGYGQGAVDHGRSALSHLFQDASWLGKARRERGGAAGRTFFLMYFFSSAIVPFSTRPVAAASSSRRAEQLFRGSERCLLLRFLPPVIKNDSVSNGRNRKPRIRCQKRGTKPDQRARISLAPVRHELLHQTGDGGIGAVLGEVPHRKLERERHPRRGARPISSRREESNSSAFQRVRGPRGPSSLLARPR